MKNVYLTYKTTPHYFPQKEMKHNIIFMLIITLSFLLHTLCANNWIPLNERRSDKDKALEKLLHDSKDPLYERAKRRPYKQTNYRRKQQL